MAGLALVAAVNDDEVLSANLLRSPVLEDADRLIAERGRASASQAYNAGLERAVANYVAFVHQDVYLPEGWDRQVMASIAMLESKGRPWGVLGIWGIRADGKHVGRVWCSGSGCEYRGQAGGMQPVVSVDEVVIVLNNRYGLRFDAQLPGFHLYATDLIMQARCRGLEAYVIEAPVVHNSWCNPQPLDGAYRAAYRYMQRKWAGKLPLKTCVVDVTRWGWPLYRQWARNELARLRGRVRARPRHPDPAVLAARLGYEEMKPGVTT